MSLPWLCYIAKMVGCYFMLCNMRLYLSRLRLFLWVSQNKWPSWRSLRGKVVQGTFRNCGWLPEVENCSKLTAKSLDLSVVRKWIGQLPEWLWTWFFPVKPSNENAALQLVDCNFMRPKEENWARPCTDFSHADTVGKTVLFWATKFAVTIMQK